MLTRQRNFKQVKSFGGKFPVILLITFDKLLIDIEVHLQATPEVCTANFLHIQH